MGCISDGDQSNLLLVWTSHTYHLCLVKLCHFFLGWSCYCSFYGIALKVNPISCYSVLFGIKSEHFLAETQSWGAEMDPSNGLNRSEVSAARLEPEGEAGLQIWRMDLEKFNSGLYTHIEMFFVYIFSW